MKISDVIKGIISNSHGSNIQETQKQHEDKVWNQNLQRWFKAKGDLTHRTNYTLNSSAIVVDVGGYEGQWASDIYARYNCTVYVFEPVKQYYDFIKNRFQKNSKIIPIHKGLWSNTGKSFINIYNENSSIMKGYDNVKEKREAIQTTTLKDFMKKYKIAKIDLLKINIEGSEYELLNSMVNDELFTLIDNIQIQFHRFVDNYKELRSRIQKSLRKTHKLTYNYPFIWENWEKIKNKS